MPSPPRATAPQKRAIILSKLSSPIADLLDHIMNTSWVNGVPESRYYPGKVADGVSLKNHIYRLRGALIFFAHRNCYVPDSATATNPTDVVLQWALFTLKQCCTVAKALANHPEPPIKGRNSIRWAEKCCKELLDAACSHLNNVPKILRTFELLYVDARGGSTNDGDVLNTLRANSGF